MSITWLPPTQAPLQEQARFRSAVSCSPLLKRASPVHMESPRLANPGAAGGNTSIAVTTQAGCPWTAGSNAAWVTITAGTSGSGTGSVSYSVAANPDATQRTGTLT